jgi:RND family efflux transporter MFP subunit
MSSKGKARRWRRIVRPIVTGAAMLAVMVVLLMWLAGAFHSKVAAGPVASRTRPVPVGAVTAEVRRTRVPRIESAVGSIRAVHETGVASKVLAKVLEMKVAAGQAVAAGEVLVRLDDADVQARLEQSQAVLAAARAQRDHAQVELGRIESLHAQRAAADIEVQRTRTLLKAAEAEVDRATQAVTEAETILAYTVIRAPMAGTIIDKRVEEGDTVRPGDVLLTLYDPDRMQLVASVRESLARRLAVDQIIGVRIDAIDKSCDGRISEIVPEAQAASRTFLVKVTGPCPPNVYTGMFGRLLIPLDEEELLVVPAAAVRRVGQLEMVDVVDGDSLRRRAVQLGISVGDDRQVLAGLREGERVLIPAP